MNKYDFGYDLIPGTTNEWAYHQIENGSTILEIGSSNGNLISHLVKEKNCIADIVEYNEEAGMQARQFARMAMIGNIYGDVEGDEWKKKIKGNLYDYIIMLDVLEHLQKPQDVINFLKNLLKDEGKLILSIPNIAHNAVIIDLLNNKFEYTEVGLLDNTHVHFFTYNSAKYMLNKAGFYITFQDVRQVEVSETELTAKYDDVPRNVSAFLKTREMGTAYQFLFCASKKAVDKPATLSYEVTYPYEIVVFREDKVLMKKNINPKNKQSITVDLTEGITAIRIDPLNRTCIIKDWSLIGYNFDGDEVLLQSLDTTGNTIGDITIFYDDDPQIYAVWRKEIVKCVFYCEFVSYDDEGLYEARSTREYVRALNEDVKTLKLLKDNLQQENVDLVHSLNDERNNFIHEQCKWRTLFQDQQQQISDLIRCIEKEHSIFIEERNRITEERDRITEERDRITEERDRITEERDRITEERDRITEEFMHIKNQINIHPWKCIAKIILRRKI